MTIKNAFTKRHQMARKVWMSAGLLAIMATALLLVGGNSTIQAAAPDSTISGLTLTSTAPGTMSVRWDVPGDAPNDYWVSWAKSSGNYKGLVQHGLDMNSPAPSRCFFWLSWLVPGLTPVLR